MFFGKFDIKISDNGMFHLPPFFEQQMQTGITYSVIVCPDDKSKGISSLIYRFSNEIYENEEPIKKYKVRKDKILRIPPSYRKVMSGKCLLIGLDEDIELVTTESQKIREAEFDDISIEAIIEEMKDYFDDGIK